MATVETPRTEVRAQARYVRTAPRKAQLVAEQIRGRPVPEARTILAFMTRDAARDVERVLNAAVANAEANHGLAGEDLYVSAAFVGAGPVLKRWRARARGRVARIRKRTCHINVHLGLPGDSAAATPAEAAETAPGEAAKPRRAPRRKSKAAGATEATEPKPKTRPKRAENPEAEQPGKGKRASRTPRKGSGAEVAEKPKRAPRRKKSEEES